MATPLQRTMTNDGPSIFYTESLRHELEMNIDILKAGRDSYYINVEPNIAYKYEFDLYGLLGYYKVPMQYHWITGRVNGFTSPSDYTDKVLRIHVPDFSVIERIKTTHTTIQRMI